MLPKRIKRLMVVSVLFLILLPAYGESQGDIDVQLTILKVESLAGKEILAPVATIKPGDVLKYELVYKVKGEDEVLELLAQLPIPEGMEYIPGTAKPAEVQASLDGNDFSPFPLQRKIITDKNPEALEEIPMAEIRYIGWLKRGLGPGEEVTVSAYLKVNFITVPVPQ